MNKLIIPWDVFKYRRRAHAWNPLEYAARVDNTPFDGSQYFHARPDESATVRQIERERPLVVARLAAGRERLAQGRIRLAARLAGTRHEHIWASVELRHLEDEVRACERCLQELANGLQRARATAEKHYRRHMAVRLRWVRADHERYLRSRRPPRAPVRVRCSNARAPRISRVVRTAAKTAAKALADPDPEPDPDGPGALPLGGAS